jgi:hypothetical protein
MQLITSSSTDPIDYYVQVTRAAAQMAIDHANQYPRASDEAEDALQRAAAHTARAEARELWLTVPERPCHRCGGQGCPSCGWTGKH